ncbi:hypothetical protein GCM10009843_00380 [Nocardioides bigeumensis]|uniref:Uncharacterized protein n=1 Tax=Nocardioides bigeumensis TaxID=433657 RepID=A0ABN2XIN3_9ACTN
MSARRSLYAAIGLLLALCVACSGDPEPQVEPAPSTPTADPLPTESPTPEPSEEPETAEEFLRRWVVEYEDMQSTGDSAPFRATSRGCRECLAIADRFEGIYSSGGFIRGGAITVTDVRRAGRIGTAESWILEFDATRTRYRETSGAPAQTLQGGHSGFRFVLEPDGGAFTIRELYQESL